MASSSARTLLSIAFGSCIDSSQGAPKKVTRTSAAEQDHVVVLHRPLVLQDVPHDRPEITLSPALRPDAAGGGQRLAATATATNTETASARLMGGGGGASKERPVKS